MNTSDAVAKTIKEIKDTDIFGCITGSSLITEDFGSWTEAPDVDVFVYNEMAFQHAVDTMLMKLNCTLGEANKCDSIKSQAWKYNRLITHGAHYKNKLNTIKMVSPYGITVNVSQRKNKETVLDVITAFDMSIVMKGYDIRKKIEVDLRQESIPETLQEIVKVTEPSNKVAVPNKFRDQDFALFTVLQWIRQFDRVIKYWNRGYDTRPMARFYHHMINKTLQIGELFTTEKAHEYYNESMKLITEQATRIDSWLKGVKEC